MTHVETALAMSSIQSGKTLGPVRFPTELFKQFLKPPSLQFAATLLESHQHDSLSPSLMEASTTHIAKKGKDPVDHPISLLNTDAKSQQRSQPSRLDEVLLQTTSSIRLALSKITILFSILDAFPRQDLRTYCFYRRRDFFTPPQYDTTFTDWHKKKKVSLHSQTCSRITVSSLLSNSQRNSICPKYTFFITYRSGISCITLYHVFLTDMVLIQLTHFSLSIEYLRACSQHLMKCHHVVTSIIGRDQDGIGIGPGAFNSC